MVVYCFVLLIWRQRSGGAADPAGLQVGATLYPLADAPFDGVTPQVCDEPASAGACAVHFVILQRVNC